MCGAGLRLLVTKSRLKPERPEHRHVLWVVVEMLGQEFPKATLAGAVLGVELSKVGMAEVLERGTYIEQRKRYSRLSAKSRFEGRSRCSDVYGPPLGRRSGEVQVCCDGQTDLVVSPGFAGGHPPRIATGPAG